MTRGTPIHLSFGHTTVATRLFRIQTVHNWQKKVIYIFFPQSYFTYPPDTIYITLV